MKTIKFLAIAFLCIGLVACNNDDDSPTPVVLLPVNADSVSNLHAPQNGGQGQPVSGDFTKFNFATGEITTSDTEWDIAFRGTTIIINGGASLGTTDEPNRTGDAAAYIADGTMTTVDAVVTDNLKQDAATGYAIEPGSGNGWYTYTGPPLFLINPIPGKIIVVRTHDGKYAKLEILSYYENAPDDPDAFMDASRYFTFNYVYQPNENVTTF
ncbi:MAG: HmuY family protein [Bacteroidota bacterium]